MRTLLAPEPICTTAFLNQNLLAPKNPPPEPPTTRAGVMSGVDAFEQQTSVAGGRLEPAGTKTYND